MVEKWHHIKAQKKVSWLNFFLLRYLDEVAKILKIRFRSFDIWLDWFRRISRYFLYRWSYRALQQFNRTWEGMVLISNNGPHRLCYFGVDFFCQLFLRCWLVCLYRGFLWGVYSRNVLIWRNILWVFWFKCLQLIRYCWCTQNWQVNIFFELGNLAVQSLNYWSIN